MAADVVVSVAVVVSVVSLLPADVEVLVVAVAVAVAVVVSVVWLLPPDVVLLLVVAVATSVSVSARRAPHRTLPSGNPIGPNGILVFTRFNCAFPFCPTTALDVCSAVRACCSCPRHQRFVAVILFYFWRLGW